MPAAGNRAARLKASRRCSRQRSVSGWNAASAAFCASSEGEMNRFWASLSTGRHVLLGRHHPAQAPAGHAEVLGETVDDEHVIGEFQRAAVAPAIGQAVIDLVHDQHAAARTRHCMDALEFTVVDQGAGRIRRRSDQYGSRLCRPVFLDQLSGQLIGRRCTDRDADWLRPPWSARNGDCTDSPDRPSAPGLPGDSNAPMVSNNAPDEPVVTAIRERGTSTP